MKKKIIALTALAAVASVAASCGTKTKPSESSVTPSSESSTEVTIVGLEVSGGTREYGIGDKVSTRGVTVLVKYSDGSKKDMTSSATFDTSAVDTSKAGNYSVSVKCAGQSSSYSVIVKDDVFDSIEFEEGSYFSSCAPFATLDLSSVKVDAVYKNAVSGVSRKVEVANKDVTFVVTNAKGEEVSGQIEEVGNYTVTATYNKKSASYNLICETKEISNIDSAIDEAIKNENTINSGVYKYSSSTQSNGENDYQLINTKNFTIGKNYTKIFETQEYNGLDIESTYTNSYYSLDQLGNIFAVETQSSSDGKDIENSATKLVANKDGHLPNLKDAKAIGFDILNLGTNIYPEYGFANSINTLYNLYLNSIDPSKKSSYDFLDFLKDSNNQSLKGFKFSFNYMYESSGILKFKHYDVEFILNNSNAISGAYIKESEYVSSINPYLSLVDIENGTTLPTDLGITLISQTNEIGNKVYSFKINEENKDNKTVTPRISTYEISQTSGLKLNDSNNPYMAKNILIDSFKASIINDDNTEITLNDGDTFNIDLDYATVSVPDKDNHRFEYKLKISDVLPDSASSTLDNVNVSIKGTSLNGDVIDSTSFKGISYAYVRNSYTSDYQYIIQIAQAGFYSVTIESLNYKIEVYYNVTSEAPNKIESYVSDGSSFSEADTLDIYTTNTIYLRAEAKSYFDQSFSACVKKFNQDLGVFEDVDKSSIVLEKTSLTILDKEYICYKFNAKTSGIYQVTLIGATPDNENKTSALSNVEINVLDVPSIKDILKGNYEYTYEANVSGEEIYKVKFEPSCQDASEGNIIITRKFDETKKQVSSYKFNNNNFIVVTETNTLGLANNAEFSLSLSSYYKLSIVNSNTEETYKLKSPTNDISDASWALLKERYTINFDDKTYEFRFNQSETRGEGSLTLIVDEIYYSYLYKYNDKTSVLETNLSGNLDDPLSGFTLNINDDEIILSNSNNTYTLTYKEFDLSEVCMGRYYVTINQVKYNLSFNDNKVTIKNNSNLRERVYTYSYDALAGSISLSYVSGSESSVGIETSLIINDYELYCIEYKTNSNNQLEKTYVKCIKEDLSGLEIPSNYIGNWTGSDKNGNLINVEIDSYSISVSSTKLNKTFEVKSIEDNIINLGSVKLTLNSDNILFNYGSGRIISTLSKKESVELIVPETIRGKYEGYNTTLVQTQVIKINDTSVEFNSYTYYLKSIDNNKYEFYDDGHSVYIEVNDNTIIFTDDYNTTYTLTNVDDKVVEFSEDYIGTWHDYTESYTLIITTNSVTLNDISASNIDLLDGIYMFDVINGDANTTYELYFNNSKLTIRIKDDTRSAKELSK